MQSEALTGALDGRNDEELPLALLILLEGLLLLDRLTFGRSRACAGRSACHARGWRASKSERGKQGLIRSWAAGRELGVSARANGRAQDMDEADVPMFARRSAS